MDAVCKTPIPFGWDYCEFTDRPEEMADDQELVKDQRALV